MHIHRNAVGGNSGLCVGSAGSTRLIKSVNMFAPGPLSANVLRTNRINFVVTNVGSVTNTPINSAVARTDAPSISRFVGGGGGDTICIYNNNTLGSCLVDHLHARLPRYDIRAATDLKLRPA